MNALSAFPPRLHWNASELADAVPLRPFQRFRVDARGLPAMPADAAPRAPASRAWHRAYRAAPALPERIRIT